MSTGSDDDQSDQPHPEWMKSEVLPEDLGDETQRRFRYQHAYGVILLVLSAVGKKNYSAVLCEHHDDLLGQLPNAQFDAFQVKTRSPDLGKWLATDEDFVGALKRFVRLHRAFPSAAHRFTFVSNVEASRASPRLKDQKKLARRLEPFLEAVKSCNDPTAIPKPFDKTFETIRTECSCEAAELHAVLQSTDFVLGPELRSFESIVSHDVLPQLPECKAMSAPELDGLRDELINRVYFASSLSVADPAQFVPSGGALPPSVIAKVLQVEDVALMVADASSTTFRYHPGLASLNLRSGKTNESRLRRKMKKGGIDSNFLVLNRQALSAEADLIGRAARAPEAMPELLNQVTSVVEAECTEAHLEASATTSEPYGNIMLVNLRKRLRSIAETQPKKVHSLPYESLIGVAGLLSGECRVWWSPEFEIPESDA